MKLEREPVFSHLAVSHKPNTNPFLDDDFTLDSAGVLQSTNWIVRDSQNRVSCDSNDNEEDAGQVLYVKNNEDDLPASGFDCSESEDDLKNSNKEEVKDFVSPYTFSSENLEALEKESDYYMDKGVTDCELPEMIVCYKENSCNTIKDICIDEGVPSQDKNWFDTGVDEKACCTVLSPDEDQKKELLEEQMDIVMTIPDGFNSSAQYDLERDFVIPCDSKDPKQRGNSSEKTATDVPTEISPLENVLSVQELGAGNSVQETVQISSETGSLMAQTESPALVSATEEWNSTEKEELVSAGEECNKCKEDELVSAAEESNCLVDGLSDNDKAETGSISFGLDPSANASITSDACPQNGVHEHFDIQTMPVDNDKDESMSDSDIVPSQGQPCLAPVVTVIEECPENGVCQCLDTSNTSKLDDDIPDSMVVSSQVQHCLAPVTIARVGSPDNGVSQDHETSNTSTSMVEDGNSDTQNAPLHFHRSLGESSFSAAVPFSSLITSGPYSANVSLRSESSTTSTRSFAFPVLQTEWNSSPVRMAKADPRHLRKHRGWRHGLLCCRF